MDKLLLIDDEQNWLHILKLTLAEHGVADYGNIYTAMSCREAFELLQKEKFDLVLLDLMMGEESGTDILQKLRQKYKALPVLMMTGVDSISSAVVCINKGAADYLVKTLPMQELMDSIRLHLESRAGKQASEEYDPHFDSFVTCSQEMFSIFKYLTHIATSPSPLLITGESGTGKGVLAESLARVSRPGKPFISVNVSGLDDQILADTLFGHVKGAFTGADSNRTGLIGKAGDGVLFLDEIGDLSVKSQIKLLHLAQDGVYQPLGSDTDIKSVCRLIFATNQNLEKKQKVGEFREDLFYRISTHHVHLPPLRERKEDIPLLAKYFTRLAAMECGKEEPLIQPTVLMLLKSCAFPGNVRQLRAILYDLVAKTGAKMLTMADFSSYFDDVDGTVGCMGEEEFLKLDELVERHIQKALNATGGNQKEAAKMVGLSPSALNRRLKK